MELNDFIGQYSLTKTLRFELKPINETNEWVEKKGIISMDNQRAEDYNKIKKIIDQFHKHHIDVSLMNFIDNLKNGEHKDDFLNDLHICCSNMGQNDPVLKKKFDAAQASLRKAIRKALYDKKLFEKDLIQKYIKEYLSELREKGGTLPDGMTIDEGEAIRDKFHGFTTYFSGFNENRNNIYTDEAKVTGVAYRLIHDNLPKYVNNMHVFEKSKEAIEINMATLQKEFAFLLKGYKIEDFFTKEDTFIDCMRQEDIDRYNTILGGFSQGDKKFKGINEYINLYNQQHKTRLPRMTQLYKMILSDREAVSWLPKSFERDSELLEAIEKYYQIFKLYVMDGDKDNCSLRYLIANISLYDPSGIYVKNDTSLTDLSKNIYGDWNTISEAMGYQYDKVYWKKNKKKIDTYMSNRKKWIDSFDSISIKDIDEYVKEFYTAKGITDEKSVIDYFSNLGKNENGTTLFEIVELAYSEVKDVLNTTPQGNLRDEKHSDEVNKIKKLLDSLKKLQWFALYLKGSGEESGRDNAFYADYNRLMEVVQEVNPLYNSVRNYLTQRPYSEEKIKLNFESSQLMNGWDLNKERDCLGVILRKDGLYYLAIMNKQDNTVLSADSIKSDGDCYEKMILKSISMSTGVGGFVRKCFGTAQKCGWVCPANCLNHEGKIIVADSEVTNNLTQLIDCYKDFFNKYEKDGFKYKDFGFKWAESSKYRSLKEFFNDIRRQSYMMKFQRVSVSYINQLVKEGKIYLFKIYNKDFSPYSKGTPNMHTMYWRALFSEDNLHNLVYTLNGNAELFYRKKSLEYDAKTMKYGHHHAELKDKFNYPIIKDRRYTEDKYFLHVPITLNFKAVEDNKISIKVRELIKENGIEHIIGIDRGERNLLYLSMIDLKGNIVKQLSLNEILNTYSGEMVDYHAKLDKRENEHDEARKNWQTIEGIKNLKEGYMSQVVHIVSKMMVEYKAIVVLEDLNGGFMRSRQKVEKQVYQKFETMLIEKLNYLVDKKKPVSEAGGLMNAYQLADEYKGFQKVGKQSGFLFYVRAWNTSKIDPATGFVSLIHAKYENIENAKKLISIFDEIRYNKEKDFFEFVISDYSKFNAKAIGTRLNWTLCSFGDRIVTYRDKNNGGNWEHKKVKLSQEFKNLFDQTNIDYTKSLKESILSQNEAPFFRKMLDLLGLMLQMRNSNPKTGEDFILSPVANDKGEFYDSRNYKEEDNLPIDADANGAYNIARKGLWTMQQIKKSDNLEKVDLALKDVDWLCFAQQKPYLVD